MIFAYFNEIFSEYRVEIVFGDISPNTRITSVRTPVAIPTALLLQIFMASVVDMEEAVRFTTLLPTRIALSILPWSSRTFVSVTALLSPASARFLIRILFTVVSAVSAEEKNADNPINRIKISNCI